MSSNSEFLWYIPNQLGTGHRGDTTPADADTLDTLKALLTGAQ